MANEKVNKVILGNETLIDLSSDTVTADKVASGYTAHDKSGESITGTGTLVDESQVTATQFDIVQGKSDYVQSETISKKKMCLFALAEGESVRVHLIAKYITPTDSLIYMEIIGSASDSDYINGYNVFVNYTCLQSNYQTDFVISDYLKPSIGVDVPINVDVFFEKYKDEILNGSTHIVIPFGVMYGNNESLNGVRFEDKRIYLKYAGHSSANGDYQFLNWFIPWLVLDISFSWDGTTLSIISSKIKFGGAFRIYGKYNCNSKEKAVFYNFPVIWDNFKITKTPNPVSIETGVSPLIIKDRRVKNLLISPKFSIEVFRAHGGCYSSCILGSSSCKTEVTVESKTFIFPFATLGIVANNNAKTFTVTATPDSKYGATVATATITTAINDYPLYVWFVPIDDLSVMMIYRWQTASANTPHSVLTGYPSSFTTLRMRMISVGGGGAKISGEINTDTARSDSTGTSGSNYTSEIFFYRLGLDNNQLGLVIDQDVQAYSAKDVTQAIPVFTLSADRKYAYFNNLRRKGNTTFALRSTANTTLYSAYNIMATNTTCGYNPINLFGASCFTQTNATNFTKYACTEPYGDLYGAPVTTNLNSVASTANNFFKYTGTAYGGYDITDVAKIREGMYIGITHLTGTQLSEFYLFNYDEVNRVATNVFYFYDTYDTTEPTDYAYNKYIAFSKPDLYNNMSGFTYAGYTIVDNILIQVWESGDSIPYYLAIGYDLSKAGDILTESSLTLSPMGCVQLDNSPFMHEDSIPYYSAEKYYTSKDAYINPYDGYAVEFES